MASLAATSYAQEVRVELASSTRPGADAQFTSVRTAPKSTAVLRRTIAVDLSRASRESALVEITRSAGIELTYSKELLPSEDAEDGVTLQATSIGAGDALEQVLRGTGLDVLLSDEQVAVLVRRPEPTSKPTPVEAQVGTIAGTVTAAETREPVASLRGSRLLRVEGARPVVRPAVSVADRGSVPGRGVHPRRPVSIHREGGDGALAAGRAGQL